MAGEDQVGAVEIQVLDPDTAPDTVDEVTELVNRVYALAEEGLWRDGATRTTSSEVRELVRNGEIAVARLGDRVVGSVRVQQFGDGVGEFGMLATDPRHQGIGIGRRLILFAERLSQERGHDTMRLELLVPKTWTHPSKDFLHKWYTRLGYRIVQKDSIDEQYPALAPLLATPCDFVIYHKKLT